MWKNCFPSWGSDAFPHTCGCDTDIRADSLRFLEMAQRCHRPLQVDNDLSAQSRLGSIVKGPRRRVANRNRLTSCAAPPQIRCYSASLTAEASRPDPRGIPQRRQIPPPPSAICWHVNIGALGLFMQNTCISRLVGVECNSFAYTNARSCLCLPSLPLDRPLTPAPSDAASAPSAKRLTTSRSGNVRFRNPLPRGVTELHVKIRIQPWM